LDGIRICATGKRLAIRFSFDAETGQPPARTHLRGTLLEGFTI
jgi:hypothetical protein